MKYDYSLKGDILARRNKRNSVANAVTVTGVTEALLVGIGHFLLVLK